MLTSSSHQWFNNEMNEAAGKLVIIKATPNFASELGDGPRAVYRACVGSKLTGDDNGRYICGLGEEWGHFPDVAPFELEFDADCVQTIEPFNDREWEVLFAWMKEDARISAEVVTPEGHHVRLEHGIIAEMVPQTVTLAHVGSPILVRIVMLNRKRRDLIVCPA